MFNVIEKETGHTFKTGLRSSKAAIDYIRKNKVRKYLTKGNTLDVVRIDEVKK